MLSFIRGQMNKVQLPGKAIIVHMPLSEKIGITICLKKTVDDDYMIVLEYTIGLILKL